MYKQMKKKESNCIRTTAENNYTLREEDAVCAVCAYYTLCVAGHSTNLNAHMSNRKKNTKKE